VRMNLPSRDSPWPMARTKMAEAASMRTLLPSERAAKVAKGRAR